MFLGEKQALRVCYMRMPFYVRYVVILVYCLTLAFCTWLIMYRVINPNDMNTCITSTANMSHAWEIVKLSRAPESPKVTPALLLSRFVKYIQIHHY